jgi:2-C-methyl-D-erythritol 2,4-cyclodiphosphate synthase
MTPLFRIGHGYDIHPFAEGRPLWLGGVHFPDSPVGLAGHSDADVLLHALCDALLGAAGLSDIGKYFLPSDMRHKDRPSIEFVGEVRILLQERGWQIGNVDVTVIAEHPKIGPRAEEMKSVISEALGIPTGAIGIKATTNEGLGFVGRKEGICSHAVALIYQEEFPGS